MTQQRESMGVLFLLHGLYLKVFVFGRAGAGKYFASLGLPDWFAWVVVLYVTVNGLGWDRPADPTDPKNHAKNRRVEVKVVPAEAQ